MIAEIGKSGVIPSQLRAYAGLIRPQRKVGGPYADLRVRLQYDSPYGSYKMKCAQQCMRLRGDDSTFRSDVISIGRSHAINTWREDALSEPHTGQLKRRWIDTVSVPRHDKGVTSHAVSGLLFSLSNSNFGTRIRPDWTRAHMRTAEPGMSNGSLVRECANNGNPGAQIHSDWTDARVRTTGWEGVPSESLMRKYINTGSSCVADAGMIREPLRVTPCHEDERHTCANQSHSIYQWYIQQLLNVFSIPCTIGSANSLLATEVARRHRTANRPFRSLVALLTAIFMNEGLTVEAGVHYLNDASIPEPLPPRPGRPWLILDI